MFFKVLNDMLEDFEIPVTIIGHKEFARDMEDRGGELADDWKNGVMDDWTNTMVDTLEYDYGMEKKIASYFVRENEIDGPHCPDCDGTNLTEVKTRCWDCDGGPG